MIARLALAAFAISSLLVVACDGDGGDGAGTPSPVATATAEPAATPMIPSAAIRELDLESDAAIVAMQSDTGGNFTQTSVLYVDVTGDDVEEAVVPLASSGTLGYVGFVVLSPDGGGGAAAILTARPELEGGFNVSVDGDQVVVVEPVRGPDDPECCPSQLRTTTYAWDGSELAIESQTTEPASQDAKTPGVSP